ncbi:MAG TPA: deoxyribonuclease IV [Candidatus Sumerlaeota bacterium]|nr:deoxyribonuclease IV [Candidatus Sumerlaeota bacterium]HPS00655.1 deoxyribonuclease IV [Candidatus Sumerlaeota bacterium]
MSKGQARTKSGDSGPVLLGAHMSISGGVDRALERGESIGCTVVQIFLKNSNRWVGKPLEASEAEAFQTRLKSSSIRSVFGHNAYLINLASPKDDLFEQSIAAMVDEIERADLLGVPFIVMHPGSPVGESEAWGLKRISEGVARILAATSPSKVQLAFENTAGQGSNLGYRFEHLAQLIADAPEKSRVGMCLDTCHAFAAGYEMRTQHDYDTTLGALDREVGLAFLKAIHLNDSKKDVGSRVDRHEHIGKGCLGLEPFRFLMNDPRLAAIPKALETPKSDDLHEDVENMAILRGLIE